MNSSLFRHFPFEPIEHYFPFYLSLFFLSLSMQFKSIRIPTATRVSVFFEIKSKKTTKYKENEMRWTHLNLISIEPEHNGTNWSPIRTVS